MTLLVCVRCGARVPTSTSATPGPCPSCAGSEFVVHTADQPPTNDPVNHPAHYTRGGVECIVAIRSALGDEAFVAFCRGQVIKYAWRAGLKDDAAQDLGKAAWYAERAAAVLKEAA